MRNRKIRAEVSRGRLLAAATLAIGLAAGTAQRAEAASVPINNPGFDATVINPFTYEGNSYVVGDPMPDHTFTTETVSGNSSPGNPATADGVSPLADSASGVPISSSPPGPSGELASVRINGTAPGGPPFSTAYSQASSPGTGILYDTRDYVAGQGPTGPGAIISSAPSDNNMRGIFQDLTTTFQPNTTYTFTAEVSDRRFGAGDNTALHTSITLTLNGSGIELPGTYTFVPPADGSTSLATYTLTTGPTLTSGVDPTGNITLVIRAGGGTPVAGVAANQTLFDNLTLDATPVPEPASMALLGIAGLAALGRRRVR